VNVNITFSWISQQGIVQVDYQLYTISYGILGRIKESQENGYDGYVETFVKVYVE